MKTSAGTEETSPGRRICLTKTWSDQCRSHIRVCRMQKNRGASPGFTNAICKYNGRSAASLTPSPGRLAYNIPQGMETEGQFLGLDVGHTKGPISWHDLPNLNIHARLEIESW